MAAVPDSPEPPAQYIDTPERFIQSSKLARTDNLKGTFAVEVRIVVFQGHKAVNVLRVLEDHPQAAMDVDQITETFNLVMGQARLLRRFTILVVRRAGNLKDLYRLVDPLGGGRGNVFVLQQHVHSSDSRRGHAP